MTASRFTELLDASARVTSPQSNVSLEAVLEETANHSRRSSTESNTSRSDKENAHPLKDLSSGKKRRKLTVSK
ncbi:hypothetical protein MMC08_008926, partial [Hypocenomyce scalaris]|nr:hypothetical protein [Hypocenomyce scalaris]